MVFVKIKIINNDIAFDITLKLELIAGFWSAVRMMPTNCRMNFIQKKEKTIIINSFNSFCRLAEVFRILVQFKKGFNRRKQA